jgi:peptide/nickel transport system permease protein
MKSLRRFLSRVPNLIALFIVISYISVAIAAPELAPDKTAEQSAAYNKMTSETRFFPHPPAKEAPFGTIATNRLNNHIDVYSNVIWGTRSALEFGLIVALTTALFGAIIGAASAYFGGLFNNVVMRITDAFLTFPIIVGVLLIQQLFNLMLGSYAPMRVLLSEAPPQPSIFMDLLSRINPLMLALILFSWMPYARVINAVVMRAKEMDYIKASRALGASHSRIILHHLLPNTISPAIVMAARDIGGVVILQATLTFIGLGGDSVWGAMLATGRRWIIGPGGNPLTYWWVFIPGTLALILFGVGWNLLGDGLNEWLNPRTVNHLEM